MTSPQLVALALFLLDGARRPVDTEDVAIRVHQLGPGRFSWRKYPDQINLELVRVALSDARKPENGSLVVGTGKSGWSLTAAGQRWASANVGDLASQDLTKDRSERTAGSIDERRWQRERARIFSTAAWTEWNANGGPIGRTSAEDVFRIDRYVVGRSRELKINRVREMFGDDQELAPFLDAAAIVVLEGNQGDH